MELYSCSTIFYFKKESQQALSINLEILKISRNIFKSHKLIPKNVQAIYLRV